MTKITGRLATAAATLAVTGGIIFASTGAASAATIEPVSQAGTVAAYQAAQHNSDSRRWDGERWWYRYNGHGDWYSSDHGDRYRYDGHRFYRWSGGKWKAVSAAYARDHSLDRNDLHGDSPRGHGSKNHGHSGHGGNGHSSDHGKGHDDHGKGHTDHSDHNGSDHSNGHDSSDHSSDHNGSDHNGSDHAAGHSGHGH
jgi:hypothetical protein